MTRLFDEIIGHQLQIRQLHQLIDNKAMPHALLFSGDAGIGKRSCAIACAAELSAKNSDKIESCQALMKAGTHPDFHTAQREEGKKDVTVEAIRELRNKLYLKPYLGGAIVALIDEAEQMNASAYNALLKTLEEPNDGTYIFLITNSLHALPETIRSRCQIIHFSKLKEDELSSLITRICPKLATEPSKLSEVTSNCCGSLELLSLQKYCNTRVIGVEPSAAIEKHALEQTRLFSEIQKQVISVIGSRDTAKALSLASSLCATKGNEHLIWSALRSSLHTRLRDTPSAKAADALSAAINAEQLANTRNVNQTILTSEILCKAANIS